MPILTLTWRPYYIPVTVDYSPLATWVKVVQWRRNDDNSLITTTPGVYIVEDPFNIPIYAGQADNLRDRFNGRSSTLHELGIVANDIPALVFAAASVVINPANYGPRLDWAEAWLVRFLFLRDAAGPARVFQNINLTGPLPIPNDGLTVNNVTAPACLTNTATGGTNFVYVGGTVL